MGLEAVTTYTYIYIYIRNIQFVSTMFHPSIFFYKKEEYLVIAVRKVNALAFSSNLD